MLSVPELLIREGLEPPYSGDVCGIHGTVAAALFDEHGKLKDGQFAKNLVTRTGDQYYGERAANIGTPPAQVTGMQLGTTATAAAKTSTGSAIVAYISGSAVAIDGTFPQSALNGSSRRITWQTTWAAGVATNAAIVEAVIINQAVATNSGAPEANTIARAVLATINKAAGDSLVITWTHDLLGA